MQHLTDGVTVRDFIFTQGVDQGQPMVSVDDVCTSYLSTALASGIASDIGLAIVRGRLIVIDAIILLSYQGKMHSHNIIHGDLTTSNLLRDSGSGLLVCSPVDLVGGRLLIVIVHY